MSQELHPGDFLVFQLEAGFGLLRLLALDESDGNKVWHLAAYSDLFPDVDSAEMAAAVPDTLNISHPHLALTDRAFESTQVARIGNSSLQEKEMTLLNGWRASDEQLISDLSVRLMLGLR
jgi:hypothetical protein